MPKARWIFGSTPKENLFLEPVFIKFVSVVFYPRISFPWTWSKGLCSCCFLLVFYFLIPNWGPQKWANKSSWFMGSSASKNSPLKYHKTERNTKTARTKTNQRFLMILSSFVWQWRNVVDLLRLFAMFLSKRVVDTIGSVYLCCVLKLFITPPSIKKIKKIIRDENSSMLCL